VVLEIGPGKGSLTSIVAPQVGRLVAIERDRKLAAELGARNAERGAANTTIVVGDALELNWHALLSSPQPVPHSAFHVPRSTLPVPTFKVVGNIPYYITSPLIDKALTPPLPERVVFLVQREVADRLVAAPGRRAYGALSVGVQAVCRVERLFVVKAGAFRPRPRVDSAVVRLTPLPDPIVRPAEIADFRRFVTACFSRRRKQLRNAVMAAAHQSAPVVTALLHDLGLSPTLRPEGLAPHDFAALLRATRQL